tara:strand:- start:5014 stop:5247 length:234 start_codon:yes stop_codon:yes gene_type:complete
MHTELRIIDKIYETGFHKSINYRDPRNPICWVSYVTGELIPYKGVNILPLFLINSINENENQIGNDIFNRYNLDLPY